MNGDVWRRRAGAALAVALAVLANGGATAIAADPQGVHPYDGANPFRCALQRVGTGTAFPHPEADPFCVEFDKTNQNVMQLGMVDFLMQEPARVAAAAGKCFYFQHDHWTGSISQGTEPELWHWDGSYYFDLARGTGGAFFGNPRLGGYGGWSQYAPLLPAGLRPFISDAGYGGKAVGNWPVSPECAKKVDTPAKARRIYRHP